MSDSPREVLFTRKTTTCAPALATVTLIYVNCLRHTVKKHNYFDVQHFHEFLRHTTKSIMNVNPTSVTARVLAFFMLQMALRYSVLLEHDPYLHKHMNARHTRIDDGSVRNREVLHTTRA